jgi:hypothetical protein
MPYSALLIFILFSFNLFGQKDNWLKDSDITYLVEVEAKVSLEEVIYLDRDKVPGWERLKMAAHCPRQGELTDRLRSMLLGQIEAGKLIARTTDRGRDLTFDEVNAQFYGLDTVAVFDPDTYQEMIQVVRTEHRIGALQLKIQLAWNESRNKLLATVVGFHVIGDQYTDGKTFFYVSLPKLPKSTFDIHDRNWGWVGQSELTFNWKNAKMLKGKSPAAFVEEVFVEQAARQASFPTYKDRCDSEPLSAEQLDLLSSSVDTISTYSPETYEETILIVRNQVEAKDVTAARLELQCYFDTDLTQLFFVPQYLSPMIAEETDHGEIRFYRPLYYLGLD